MIGDAALFQRADMVEGGWKVVDPVLDVWRALPPRKFPNYASGSWGPADADQLLERDGRHWRRIEPCFLLSNDSCRGDRRNAYAAGRFRNRGQSAAKFRGKKLSEPAA